jgi:hypothetical protein
MDLSTHYGVEDLDRVDVFQDFRAKMLGGNALAPLGLS